MTVSKPPTPVRLGCGDAGELLAFRRLIIDGLADKDFLRDEPDEPAFVDRLLGDGGLTLAIVADGRIVAYTSLILPAALADFRPFGIADHASRLAVEPDQIAYIAATMVDPGYRGRGFQHVLTRARGDATCALGRTHHLATAALGNQFSWRNAMTNGFHVRDVVELRDPAYGPLTRFLLYRPPEPMTVAGPPVWTDATDPERQKALLSARYRGVEHRLVQGVPQIGYRRGDVPRHASPRWEGQYSDVDGWHPSGG